VNTAPAAVPPGAARKRALVLHGGGSAGNAWEIGVVAGLLAGGLDVTEADLIVGTSAGSTAAAQITGAPAAELLAAIAYEAARQQAGPAGPAGPAGGPGRIVPAANHMEITSQVIAAAADAADMRRRMGAAALEADTASDGTAQARWRATVASRLPPARSSPTWVARSMPHSAGCRDLPPNGDSTSTRAYPAARSAFSLRR